MAEINQKQKYSGAMQIALLLAAMSVATAFTDIPTDLGFYNNFLKNTTAVKNLFGCILEKNPCDEFGSHVKSHFDEAVQAKKLCADCDPVQKHAVHIMDQLVQQEEYKEYFDEFRARFDPDGKYFEQLEESVKNY